MSEHDRESNQGFDQEQTQKEHGQEQNKTKDQEKTYPTHTVSFARIIGQDRFGKDILGPARQVGTIWPRQGKEGDGIQRFDHIPEEMRSHGGGVLFVREYSPQTREPAEKKKSEPEHER